VTLLITFDIIHILLKTLNPNIYPLDDHGISADKIDPHACQVIERLKAAGHKAYLVGGGVRDLLLGFPPKDFDVSTSAEPEEIRLLFRNAILIGRRFRLAHIRFGKKIIEVSTFRAGESEADTLIVRDNIWGTEEEDVLRRDFTINGLFYDPATQTVIDYVGGVSDIEKKVLRSIGTPSTRFRQDPVRMIRLLKFGARFHLEIDEKTFEALFESKHLIKQSSPARVLEELLRMLESGAAGPFFSLLYEHGLLDELLPELAQFFRTTSPEPSLRLLKSFDTLIQEKLLDATERALALSILLLPFFESYVQLIEEQKNKPLHLGQITSAANHLIHYTFAPFFKLPNRLRAITGMLLSNQYRFMRKAVKAAVKIPRDPMFFLTLELLKVRAYQDPSLEPVFAVWQEAFDRAVSKDLVPPKHRPSRRRR
jgi:poly(A) polymerase